MSVRKITTWHEGGLIDADTRDRLLAYEASHTRPLALWAVFGIGALAIGLGLVSVIAANWEDIPGQLRLAVHFALIIGALAALFLREDRIAERSPWAVEALLFVTAALGLTFFGHLGQVYQTSSPLWKPLATWLVLFAPLLLLMGRSWPAAAAVMGGAVWCVWEYATAMTGYGAVRDPSYLWQAWLGFVIGLPVVLALAAASRRAHSQRPEFWRRLEQLALVYAVAGASLTCALASAGGYGDGGVWGGDDFFIHCGSVALATGLLLMQARRGVSGRMAGSIVGGAGLVVMSAQLTEDLTVPAAALFMALWIGIAAAALVAGWRGVFQLSVGVIAVRLIILSFELASDLLLSGFGLILSGFMILGVAWVAVRVSKTFAPPSEGAEA